MKNIDIFIFELSRIFQSKIIGILLIVIGIIFLYNPININIKVGSSLIILGFLFFFFFDLKEKEIQRIITGRYLTFISGLWIGLAFIITRNIETDIFLIIVILGILSIIILLDELLDLQLKKRTNILIFILILFLAIIIGQRIIFFFTI